MYLVKMTMTSKIPNTGRSLNVADDGVMGYLSIPKINIKLAIYHGTGDDELQTGVGHLNGTKLPIGGREYPQCSRSSPWTSKRKAFTDIDQLKVGDKFYIHVLDEVLPQGRSDSSDGRQRRS